MEGGKGWVRENVGVGVGMVAGEGPFQFNHTVTSYSTSHAIIIHLTSAKAEGHELRFLTSFAYANFGEDCKKSSLDSAKTLLPIFSSLLIPSSHRKYTPLPGK